MDRYTRRVFRDASLPAKHILIFRTLWFWQNEAKFANLFKGRLACIKPNVMGDWIRPSQLDACYRNSAKDPSLARFQSQLEPSCGRPEGAFAAGVSFGSLKYKHHFGLDCFSIRREQWALQASLTHSINDDFLLRLS